MTTMTSTEHDVADLTLADEATASSSGPHWRCPSSA